MHKIVCTVCFSLHKPVWSETYYFLDSLLASREASFFECLTVICVFTNNCFNLVSCEELFIVSHMSKTRMLLSVFPLAVKFDPLLHGFHDCSGEMPAAFPRVRDNEAKLMWWHSGYAKESLKCIHEYYIRHIYLKWSPLIQMLKIHHFFNADFIS